MKAKPVLLAVVMLALMAGATLLLAHTKSGHKLGAPGVKTRPLANSGNLEVVLPENLPGYNSTALPESDMVTNRLPKDTSFGQRVYVSTNDHFRVTLNVVLMGSDRSSIHKPEICLTGQGWACDNQATRQEQIPMEQPYPYQLTVNKYVASQEFEQNGVKIPARGLYIYWYVDGTHLTADQWRWMSVWIPQDLILHGLLERWAYISYFATCAPGQEDATFARMKRLIAATVPQFQLVPAKPAGH